MNKNLDNLTFIEPEKLNKKYAFNSIIPKNIRSKGELMKALKIQLLLPDYFGENWDALNDVLNDFSWIEEFTIIIIHEDLPNLPAHELKIYLDTLNNAVKEWKNLSKEDMKYFQENNIKSHELIVSFPPELEDKIRIYSN